MMCHHFRDIVILISPKGTGDETLGWEEISPALALINP